MTRSLKTLALGTLVLAGTLACGVAQAGPNVYWSVGVSAPGYPVGVDAVFSNAPRGVGYSQPVYMAPPVAYAAYPGVYAAPAVYVRPLPVVYGPPAYYYGDRGWRRDHRHDRHDRHSY
jgi:hypothetical protein